MHGVIAAHVSPTGASAAVAEQKIGIGAGRGADRGVGDRDAPASAVLRVQSELVQGASEQGVEGIDAGADRAARQSQRVGPGKRIEEMGMPGCTPEAFPVQRSRSGPGHGRTVRPAPLPRGRHSRPTARPTGPGSPRGLQGDRPERAFQAGDLGHRRVGRRPPRQVTPQPARWSPRCPARPLEPPREARHRPVVDELSERRRARPCGRPRIKVGALDGPQPDHRDVERCDIQLLERLAVARSWSGVEAARRGPPAPRTRSAPPRGRPARPR